MWIKLSLCLLQLYVFYKAVSTRPSFEKIHNGVLVTQGGSDLRVVRKLWKVYITINPPKLPKDLPSFMDTLKEFVFNGYEYNLITSQQRDNTITELDMIAHSFVTVASEALQKPEDQIVNDYFTENTGYNKPSKEHTLCKQSQQGVLCSSTGEYNVDGTIRKKRGLLDIVGKGLHYLFGVADSDTMRVVQHRLTQVMDNVYRIHHDNAQLISTVNAIQGHVSLNRKTINKNIRNINYLIDFAGKVNASLNAIVFKIKKAQFLQEIRFLTQHLRHVSHQFQHLIEKYISIYHFSN